MSDRKYHIETLAVHAGQSPHFRFAVAEERRETGIHRAVLQMVEPRSSFMLHIVPCINGVSAAP